MDTRIATTARPDIVTIESAPRPTPSPVRVSFGQVLSAGVSTLVQGAELAASSLPGSPITATAVRGGASPAISSAAGPLGGLAAAVGAIPTVAAEGPVASTSASPGMAGTAIGPGTAAPTGTTDATGGIDASLQQSAQLNMYYLQLQEQVDAQNRSFTTISNVLKAEHDTAKGAIGNIHS